MSTTAQYASTPKVGIALLTTADTSLTAPTTVGTVLTAGASGSRIDYIEVMGVATTVAGLINLFLYDGSTYTLWQQIPVQAITTATTTPSFVANLSSNGNANIMPLNIPTGYSLRATTTVAQTGVKVIAYGGDF
jgi:diphthamide biosynthesis methyltransferase